MASAIRKSTLLFIIKIVFLCIHATAASHLQGHEQELGKHRDPIGHIDVLQTLPSPTEFWDRYASRRRPVLFKGAAKHSSGMNLWTDEYLLKNYGDLKVKIESKAEKESSPSGVKGLGQDTIETFLKSYKKRNAYIVSQLPDPMAHEVAVLPFLTCGTFGERILEANLWMSAGGTKSLLHRDADNAINCLFAGRKDWIFVHPSFEDQIPIAKEEVEAYGGFSLLNPDSINLEKYPEFAEVNWSYANVTAGDCLFLPYGYWHQVRSYERNQAVSVLFSRLTEVDLSGCHDNDLHFKPLSEVNMVFTYDGYGDQTMGDTDPFELNETLKDWCSYFSMLDHPRILTALLQEHGVESDDDMPNHIHSNQHEQVFHEDGVSERMADVKVVLTNVAEKVLQVLDTDHDGQVSCDRELSGLTLGTLKTLANIIGSDSGNTEHHEFTTYTPKQIRDFLMKCMKNADTFFNGELPSANFLKLYQDFGGSEKGGKEVLSILDEEDNGFISRDEVHSNMERVLMLYDVKKSKPDSSNLLWEKEQQEYQEDLDNRLMEDPRTWKTHLHDDL